MKNKIFIGLGVIILIGIIITAVLGLNVDYSYKNHTLIDVKIGKDFQISDIKAITNEVFQKKKVEIQVAGDYNDSVVIRVDEVTDEQKATLNTKINEKYGINNTVDDIKINKIPSYRLRDIIKAYLIPLALTTVLILIYMSVRYRKIGLSKVIGQTLLFVVMGELLYGALIAITRFPVDRLTLPAAIVIYLGVITKLTGEFEKGIKVKEK